MCSCNNRLLYAMLSDVILQLDCALENLSADLPEEFHVQEVNPYTNIPYDFVPILDGLNQLSSRLSSFVSNLEDD